MSLIRNRPRTQLPRLYLALALIAVLVKVLVPPGFMIAPANADGRAGIPLVICTGHGPATAAGETGGKAPGQTPRADTICAFAGYASAAAAPISAPIPAPWTWSRAPLVLARIDLAPGRGLAAPPPPSQGPPDRIL